LKYGDFSVHAKGDKQTISATGQAGETSRNEYATARLNCSVTGSPWESSVLWMK